jgi:cytochrome c553
MFHIKYSIAASLALSVLLSSAAAFAEGDSSTATAKTDTATTKTDTDKSTQKKQPKKKHTKSAPKADAVAPPTDASAPPKSDVSTPPKSDVAAPPPSAASASPKVEVSTPPKNDTSGDSAETIKQRSGPGNPVAGKEKSELCQGCHGEEGVSAEGFAPKLAGQYGVYIAKQLRNFQAGTRVHQIMSAIAATISDDDLADIAAYFASRTKMVGAGSNNKLGEQLFLHGDMSRMMVPCFNCHGVNGKGKTPTNPVFPVIGGQHKDYIRGQLINFRAGDRSNSPGGIMNIITQKMTDAELDALSEYVSGL